MNIAFLNGSSHPNFDAVSYCGYQVQRRLAADFAISVIASRSSAHQPDEEVVEGIRVHRFETVDMRRRTAALNGNGLLPSVRLQALRVHGALRRLLSPVTVNQQLVTAYFNSLQRLGTKPNVLIPQVFPFETVMAALAYKAQHPNVVLVPYLFDDFVDSGSLHVFRFAREMKRSRHLELERRLLSEAHAVLAMHPLRRHLESNFEERLLRKITFLEHPLLVPRKTVVQKNRDGVLRFCFTGSLIRGVREPYYLLALLGALRLSGRAAADFYVLGNAAQAIPTSVLENGLEIRNHGGVAKHEADEAVDRADILINIGEKTGKQISSKVFEYISVGKPILHIASRRDDAVSKILYKYPLALCLLAEENKISANAQFVSNFIAQGDFPSLTFDQVEAIFPEALPSVTAETIKRILISIEHNNAGSV